MFSVELLLQSISLGLLFILFITGAWRKSISTSIYIISLALAFQCYVCERPEWGGAFITFGALIALIRAMFHEENDSLMRNP